MTDQACTTSGYANDTSGCIGTAVHQHDLGLLPMTGAPIAYIAAVAAAAILLGVLLALAARRAGAAEQEARAKTLDEARQDLHEAARDAGAQIVTALMPALERIAAAANEVDKAIQRRAAKGPGHPEG